MCSKNIPTMLGKPSQKKKKKLKQKLAAGCGTQNQYYNTIMRKDAAEHIQYT